MTTTKIITSLILTVMLASLASALIVEDVSVGKLTPGEQTSLSVDVRNDGSNTIKNVNLVLDFSNLPISAVGNSVDGVDEIQDDDSESFAFTIKASSTSKLGTYSVPYTITYTNQSSSIKGTISVEVTGDVNLEYSAVTETPILNQQGKVSLKIVNKGMADARFVNINLNPQGFTLLGSNEDYIGTVASDDFETASFDVIFNSQSALLNAQIEYRDFDNNLKTDIINLPLTVYSQEQALQLGLVKKNNTFIYVIVVVALIILYLVYRAIRRRLRRKKAEAGR